MCIDPELQKRVDGVATFLTPARRGRGILIAPGFRQASGVRRHVFLWAQKLKKIVWLI